MARPPNFTSQFIILSLLFSSFAIILANIHDHEFVQAIDKDQFGLGQEKISHFRLYWHDILTGPHPSSIPIVTPPGSKSRLPFGLVRMIDNPLTLGPELGSKLVGRAQGLYAQASQQQEIALLMVMNFVFTEGKYNGSTITILGRNPILSPVREMPVVGGSGLFRFARGYAKARTHWFNASTGDATVEYNIYVLHY